MYSTITTQSVSYSTLTGSSIVSNVVTGSVIGGNAMTVSTLTMTGNTINFPASNVFIGQNTGPVASGLYNTFLGTSAGAVNTTGNQNTFIGHLTGASTISGQQNVYVGTNAGYGATSTYNVLIGCNAGSAALTGVQNTFVGGASGVSTISGAYNTFLGWGAGITTATGSNNIYIGASAVGNASGNSNEIVIGQGATGNGTNTITLGNSSIIGFYNSNLFAITKSSTYTVFTSTADMTIKTGGTNSTLYIESQGTGNINLNTNGSGLINFTNLSTTYASVGSSGTSFNYPVTIGYSASTALNIAYETNTSSAIFVRAGTSNPTASVIIMYMVNYNNTVVRGTITSTSDSTTVYTSGSDRRIKNSIRELPDIRSLVEKLHPCGFKFNCVPNGPEHVGFIAQEVREHYPHLVVGDESTTTLQLDYGTFSPYAVGGVLDLYKITDSIIAKNTLLETTVKQQAIEITALQSQLAQVLQRLSAAGIA